jgi:hypothetical protein
MNHCEKCGEVKISNTCLRCTYGSIAADTSKDPDFIKVLLEAMLRKVQRERDERQKLLEDVFGNECSTCACCQSNDSFHFPTCLLLAEVCKNDSGRRDDCPFLPFEVKK